MPIKIRLEDRSLLVISLKDMIKSAKRDSNFFVAKCNSLQ